MNVLVTGATGFVGQHVVPRLLEFGHAVTATARDERKARCLDWFGSVRFVAADLEDAPGAPPELFSCPQAVVHLAWPDLSDYASSRHVEITLPAHERFLKALLDSGCRHLLVAGTCLEYGMKNGSLSETAATEPVNAYARAKDMLRAMLEDLQEKQPFTLQWARLFYIYGRGQHPNSLLAQLDRAIDTGAQYFDMSTGEQLRDYLPVDEVAERLVSLLDHPECQGPVNVCSGQPEGSLSNISPPDARKSA